MWVFNKKLLCLSFLLLLISSCGSMQQMQDASIVPAGEKESVFALSATPFFSDDSDEMVLISMLQYNARHGINSKLDFGYQLNLPVIFGVNSEDTAPIAPMFPSFGTDLKFQIKSSDSFDLAVDAGLNLSIASSLNVGVIMSNANNYASIYSHYAQVPNLGFGNSLSNTSFTYGYSFTLGHRAENIIYELRLPVINDESNETFTIRPPIFSIGVQL